MSTLLLFMASLLGAAAIVWMGGDFAGSNTLAFTVTACIGGVYLIGIIELLRFRRATTSLSNALTTLTGEVTATPQWLEQWLQRLDSSLYGSVRARIVGERTALPTPAFTPYLVGLLVMLGLLGTFVGMVDTLGGAVSALQGSTELDAIRASLTAPMRGLGVAFGTSVAGVAASAMLGLISTLVRHHRILVTRQLDAKIATVFSAFSLGHQRQRAFDAIESQAAALPAVAGDLQTVATKLVEMGDKLSAALLHNQQQFHTVTEQRFNVLATAVDQSLRDSLAASGKAAGDSMQPVLISAVADISKLLQETQQQQAVASRDQLKALGDEFGVASNSVLQTFATTSSDWSKQTLALQNNIKTTLRESVQELSDTARTSTTGMLAEIGELLQSTQTLVEARTAAEAAWLESRKASEAALLDSQGERLEQLTAAVTGQLDALRAQEEQGQIAAVARLEQLTETVGGQLDALRTQEEQGQLAAVAQLEQLTAAVSEQLDTLRTQEEQGQITAFARQEKLTETVTAQLQALRTQEEQGQLATLARLEQLTAAMTAQVDTLQAREEQSQIAAAARLSELESTVSTHLTQLGQGLEAPMTRLIETASETPRAAAEVIGLLRAEITNNVERDNQLLEERLTVMRDLKALSESLQTSSSEQRDAVEHLIKSSTALLQDTACGQRSSMESLVSSSATLLQEAASGQRSAVEELVTSSATLLQEVANGQRTAVEDLVVSSASLLQEAASEQRSAVEHLVTSSATLLQETASSQRSAVENLVASSTALMQETTSQFGDHLLAEVSKISEASAHVAGGAIELSSLGEAFSLAVNLFNSSNEAMMEHLARVEEAMAQSSNRSDEQMAYYVSQAREIIDHSMSSQKEIMEDMQRISRQARQQTGGAQ